MLSSIEAGEPGAEQSRLIHRVIPRINGGGAIGLGRSPISEQLSRMKVAFDVVTASFAILNTIVNEDGGVRIAARRRAVGQPNEGNPEGFALAHDASFAGAGIVRMTPFSSMRAVPKVVRNRYSTAATAD